MPVNRSHSRTNPGRLARKACQSPGNIYRNLADRQTARLDSAGGERDGLFAQRLEGDVSDAITPSAAPLTCPLPSPYRRGEKGKGSVVGPKLRRQTLFKTGLQLSRTALGERGR